MARLTFDLVVYPLDALSLYILMISPSTPSFTFDLELDLSGILLIPGNSKYGGPFPPTLAARAASVLIHINESTVGYNFRSVLVLVSGYQTQ